jgi:hypothetical protein
MSQPPPLQRVGVEPRQLVTNVAANDVLLGRGNHVHNPGNAKFRMMVLSRSHEYWSCNNNVTKDSIAREIIDQITSQGGRFLRKIKNASIGAGGVLVAEAASGSNFDEPSSSESNVWEIADMETILVKVKQTFRDFTASAKKKSQTSTSSLLTERSQLTSMIRQRSNQIPESDKASSNLYQSTTGAASAPDLRRLENTLLSTGILSNIGHEYTTPPMLRPNARDSLFPNTSTLQLEPLNDRTLDARTDFGELLIRQRAIASWQELLRQQQLVSEANAILNFNRQLPVGDPTPLLQQSNTLQDQLRLRHLLLQRSSLQSQPDLTALARTLNAQQLLLNRILPRNVSNSHQFVPTLDELHRTHRQQNLQQLGNIDLQNATFRLHETSPHLIGTNVLRQLAEAPAYETSFPLINRNDNSYLDTAVANAMARQNLLSNVATDSTPHPSNTIDQKSVDDDSDDDKKPAASNN